MTPSAKRVKTRAQQRDHEQRHQRQAAGGAERVRRRVRADARAVTQQHVRRSPPKPGGVVASTNTEHASAAASGTAPHARPVIELLTSEQKSVWHLQRRVVDRDQILERVRLAGDRSCGFDQVWLGRGSQVCGSQVIGAATASAINAATPLGGV